MESYIAIRARLDSRVHFRFHEDFQCLWGAEEESCPGKLFLFLENVWNQSYMKLDIFHYENLWLNNFVGCWEFIHDFVSLLGKLIGYKLINFLRTEARFVAGLCFVLLQFCGLTLVSSFPSFCINQYCIWRKPSTQTRSRFGLSFMDSKLLIELAWCDEQRQKMTHASV